MFVASVITANRRSKVGAFFQFLRFKIYDSILELKIKLVSVIWRDKPQYFAELLDKEFEKYLSNTNEAKVRLEKIVFISKSLEEFILYNKILADLDADHEFIKLVRLQVPGILEIVKSCKTAFSISEINLFKAFF